MSSTQASSSRSERNWTRRVWRWGVVLGVVVVGVGIAATVSSAPSPPPANHALTRVQEGSLEIGVSASGSVKSGKAAVIKNKVEGRHAILWIIEDGTRVEKGDKLLELDSSDLEDRKVNQEIAAETAKANKITAKQNLEIAKKQAEADVDDARVSLRLAILDLEKYTGVDVQKLLALPETRAKRMDLPAVARKLEQVDWQSIDWSKYQTGTEGKYQTELEKAQNKIIIARSEQERAKDTLKGSRKLAEKGYITENELEADQLAEKKKRLDLSVAKSEKRLLEKYTRKRKVAEYVSAVSQAAFALEKAKHNADASVADAKAKLSAQTAKYKQEKRKLAKIKRQLEHCVVRAPKAGKVIHAQTRRRREPLAEGVEVRERQELFRIPNAGKMVAEVEVHESKVRLVRAAMGRSGRVRARITTDAIAGKSFRGHVKSVATMPDAQRRFVNPGLKVYTTKIGIDDPSGSLQPGMSCSAVIVIKELKSVAHLPIQCVRRANGRQWVYVLGSDGKPEPRAVVTGMDNDRQVRIKSGVEVGERVLLNPPAELPEKVRKQAQRGNKEGNRPPRGQGGADRPRAGGQDRRREDRGGERDPERGPSPEAGDRTDRSEEQRKELKKRGKNVSEEKRRRKMQRRAQGDSDGGKRAGAERRSNRGSGGEE